MTGLELWMVWTSISPPWCEIPPVELAEDIARHSHNHCVIRHDGAVGGWFIGMRAGEVQYRLRIEGAYAPLNTLIVCALKRRVINGWTARPPSPELLKWAKS